MYKNIIFDFGNVLAEFYPERLTRASFDDEENLQIVSDVVFDRLYWNRLDDGTITDEQLKAEALKRLPENLKKPACKVYDNWVSNLTPVKGMTELVNNLKKAGTKLFLISNISIGFSEKYKNVPWIFELLSQFDGLVFSGPLGLTKPGKEIFEYTLEKYNLNESECLFIDDSKINITGAENTGIKGYLFDGDAHKLEKYLSEC